MQDTHSQAKILAQGIYEIRLLLAGYLGSQNEGDPQVRRAAHIAYALHNEALAVIGSGTFDSVKALDKIRAVDRMFEETFAPRFESHVSNNAKVCAAAKLGLLRRRGTTHLTIQITGAGRWISGQYERNRRR